MPMMSILNEVVREVNALSALLYAAAMSPNTKKMAIPMPNPLCVAIIGNS